MSLATGSRQLARRKVLVKRLVTIEDLGNIRMLFTDKTGTLTQGAIAFDQSLDGAGIKSTEPLLLGLLCNEATLTKDGPIGGNPLDQALWVAPETSVLMAHAGGPVTYQRLGIVPFDHDRQLVSVTVAGATGRTLLVTKGAPEVVLARCVDAPSTAGAVLEELFGNGARVVGVASREVTTSKQLSQEDEHDLHFAGFLSFSDPPKADAGASIAKLHALDIDVKIITGDRGGQHLSVPWIALRRIRRDLHPSDGSPGRPH